MHTAACIALNKCAATVSAKSPAASAYEFRATETIGVETKSFRWNSKRPRGGLRARRQCGGACAQWPGSAPRLFLGAPVGPPPTARFPQEVGRGAIRAVPVIRVAILIDVTITGLLRVSRVSETGAGLFYVGHRRHVRRYRWEPKNWRHFVGAQFEGNRV
jgi:hypothetical protein